MPRGRKVEFHTIDHEGFRRIAGGKLVEVGDDLHILIGPAEPADSVSLPLSAGAGKRRTLGGTVERITLRMIRLLVNGADLFCEM